MGSKLNVIRQGCLKRPMLNFEEQQQNISTFTQPLTTSGQNSCLSPWILESFKTLKKYQQFGLKMLKD